jgi:nucleoside-diphosphate-sugar epimerase
MKKQQFWREMNNNGGPCMWGSRLYWKKVENAPRRVGDPPILVASSEKARNELGWNRKYNTLEEMISSAWNWMQKHPGGYREQVEVK